MSFTKFLKGALKYRHEVKPIIAKELDAINKDPKVKSPDTPDRESGDRSAG